jgi:hypothetical protein
VGNFREWGLLEGDSTEEIAGVLSAIGRMGGWGVIEIRSSESAALIRNESCQLNGLRHSFCPVHCGVLGKEGVESMRSGGELRIENSIRDGDIECRLLIIDKGGPAPKIESMHLLPIPPIEEEMRVHLAPNFLYWYWLFILNGISDSIGQEKAFEMLSPQMAELGRMAAREFDDPIRIGEAEQMIAEPLRRLTASVSIEGKNIVIEGCPFAWHSGLSCSLMHRFLDGMGQTCEREVKWEAQVPRGDPSCKFCLTSGERVSGEGELLLMLKARLVRGEISYEEYQQIRRELDS